MINKIQDRRAALLWISAVILLLTSGILYRVLQTKIEAAFASPMVMPVSLGMIPTTYHDWNGQEVPILAVIESYMRENYADDYVSRRYEKGGLQFELYVVCCVKNIAGIVGHRPEVCYPSSGWSLESSEELTFEAKDGRRVPCLLQQFSKNYPYQNIYVLSYYVVNGQLTNKESEFSNFWNRRLNVGKEPMRYVSQVQISAASRSTAILAGTEFTDLILEYMPSSSKQGDIAR